MKKILEFCGKPELLIALLYSDDVCQTIKNQVMSSGKVSMFVFAEDEPCYAPDSDEIKPQVNLGEPVQVVDDLHYDEVAARELWSEEDEQRMRNVMVNGNDGLIYTVNGDEHDAEVVGT